LRVLGTAELPPREQGVRQERHANMPLLPVCKPQEAPLELLCPRTCPIDTRPQSLPRVVAASLPSSRWPRAVAWMLGEVGDPARLEQALALGRGRHARLAIERGASQVSTAVVDDLLQGV